MEKRWIAADGSLDVLEGEEFQAIFNQFKEEMAKHGLIVKQFDHDPNHQD
jgi:hypothetical protein